jgi:hypothetical protein
VNRCAVNVKQEDSQCCSDVNVNILMEKPIIHQINYGASAYSLYNEKDLPLFVKLVFLLRRIKQQCLMLQNIHILCSVHINLTH